MVSLLTGSSRTIFACSSNRNSVHPESLSGAALHAISIIRASTRPLSLHLALLDLTLRFNVMMPSIPFSQKSLTVFVMVAIQTQFVLADYSCVRTLPCTSSRSMMIWHLFRTVFDVRFLRTTDFSLSKSPSVNEIL